MLRVLFRRRLRLTITEDGITDIVTTAIITHTITVAITIDISTVATIIGTAFGWPVPVDIIAIGKPWMLRRVRSIERLAKTNSRNSPQRKRSC